MAGFDRGEARRRLRGRLFENHDLPSGAAPGARDTSVVVDRRSRDQLLPFPRRPARGMRAPVAKKETHASRAGFSFFRSARLICCSGRVASLSNCRRR